MEMTKQQKEFYKTFSRHGNGASVVKINPSDIVLLVHIAYKDIFEEKADWFKEEFAQLSNKFFYDITRTEIDSLPDMLEKDAMKYIILCGAADINNPIYLYLKNLAELYRRRFKFLNILKTQPFPAIEQIGLRSLLEYGNCNNPLLFSWMKWRKLIYDIDNRSAQETGYLFEPILASCLGGESVPHQHSPVKRVNANGEPLSDGRQIDCYIEETKEVYELKLRVTIAASGQGRFLEEMSFPYEAKCAGLKPILIVFDSTPSALLEKLKQKYISEGGSCAVGDEAWRLLIERAGSEMGKFIWKYIKPIIENMEKLDTEFPCNVHLKIKNGDISIEDDDNNMYYIHRARKNTDE